MSNSDQHFSRWGLQSKVESFIQSTEKRLFTNFHRQVRGEGYDDSQWYLLINIFFQLFFWTDKWHGMTMDDIRALEEETKRKLDEDREKGDIKGTAALEK